ncbi:MAG: dockerin type I repeat-containing protein [Myxococcota bacterium]
MRALARASWRAAWCLVCLGATLTNGPADRLVLGCFAPPAVRFDLADPNVAWAACASIVPGAFPFRVDPSGGLQAAPGRAAFLLPAALSGGTIDDVVLERPDLAWVTVSGGVEGIVPFDPQTGAAIPVRFEGTLGAFVPTQVSFSGAFTRSDGSQVGQFTTNFTSGVARVGNRLLAVTSNFAATGLNAVNNPGTVLLFDVDESQPGEISVDRPVSGPDHVLTSDFNPTGIVALPSGPVAVTNTGVLILTTPPTAGSAASIDLIEPSSGAPLLSIPLGLATPAFRDLALDSTGSVGVIGSAALRQLYAIDLRGVGSFVDPGVDPTLQRTSCNAGAGAGVPCAPARVVRGVANPIAIPASPQGMPSPDGFVPDVEFGGDGGFIIATASDDGLLAVAPFDPRNLSGPHPLLASRFGAVEAFQVTPAAEAAVGQEHGPGPLALRPPPGGGLAGTLAVWTTLGPAGRLDRGVLGGTLPGPTGDLDGDGSEDALDDCPLLANPGQADAGGIGASGPDGIGDACQCGDASGDGGVDALDLAAISDCLAGAIPCASLCDTNGDGLCDVSDVTAVQLVLAASAAPRCAAFTLP